jgi:very-short-patch-repair endonuclease
MTSAERLLWSTLRAHGLEGLHFRRQQVIDGFIVDFYCSAATLVVEVDGPVHAAQQDYDRQRDHILATRGINILRLTNDDIAHHLPVTLQRIADACRTSATSPTLPVTAPPSPLVASNTTLAPLQQSGPAPAL